MSYIVAHCRKVQTAVGLRNVAAHNCREGVYDAKGRAVGELPEYISHPERAAMNEGDRCGGLVVLKRRSDRIQEANLARKPQKNASAAVEVVISASPEWFDSHPQKDWPGYFKDARKFLTDRYGKENLLHWAVHYDEKTPHMHVIMAPIIEGKNGPRYSSSNFLGGRKGLRDLQDELARQVGKPYGLERGVKGSEARHTDQYGWAAETAVERNKLAMERGALDIRETKLAAETAKAAKALQEQRDRIGADMKKTAAIHEATEAILATHEGAKLGRKLGTILYNVPQSRYPDCWKAMEERAEEIRREERTRGSTRTRGPNERGGR